MSEKHSVPGASETGMPELPLNAFVRRLTLLSAMGVFLDGYDLTIISVALLFIIPHFHPSATLLGMVGAAAVAGMFVGSLVFGNLSDRFGRRTMYLLDLLFFVVFAILSALSQNITELIVFRFLLGIGIGADYPVSSALTAEFSPTKKRGLLLVATIASYQVGAVVAYLVGLALIPLGPDAWRWMLASGAVPALLVMWSRRSIPESPRWLIRAGKVAEGQEVYRSIGHAALQQTVEANKTTQREQNAKPKTSELGDFRRLFRKDLIRMTVFTALTWFLFDSGAYAFSVFYPTIFKSLKGSTIESSVLASAIIAAVAFVGIILDLLLVDRVGRKYLQAVGLLGLGLMFILLSVITPGFSVFVILFMIMYIFLQAPAQMTYLFSVEVFPTSVRATGQGFATAISRLGGLMGIFIFPLLMKDMGLSTGVRILGIAVLLAFILTVWLAPETRNQPLSDN
ncbi:MAG: MFS transporter [Sulfobacillus benefaciens]|uniref:MFS transporter n=1 Tax=Sulfobacillus benefaciens TaxID=453960 RepID=A0A2T2WR55_9FIRM|nr:MAG: MFS transporter [Sulfobacillus benefaciens]